MAAPIKPPAFLSTEVLLWSTLLALLTSAHEDSVPAFISPLPSSVDFSNSTGGRVMCSVKGNPQPTIKWILSDGTPVLDVQGLRHINADGSLEFPPFRAEDFRQDVHATVYKCTASNSVGTLVSKEIKIRGVVPQLYDIYVYDVYAIKGNVANLKCHIPHLVTDYVTVVSWIRDSVVEIKRTEFNQASKYNILPNGDLYVNEVSSDDANTSFRCKTIDRLTGKIKTSVTSGKLFITDPENHVKPKITNGKTTLLLNSGSTVVIPCITQGKPTPVIKWMTKSENGRDQEIIGNARFVQMNGFLYIREAESKDAGIYTCSASNDIGEEKKETQLIVSELLQVSLQPALLTVDIGKSVVLRCSVSGEPVNSITWLKDSGPLRPGIHVIDNYTLNIESVTTNDKGIYQCFASNDIDSVFATSVIKLGDISPILSQTFEEQILHPGDKVILKCVAAGNPVPTISWSVDDMDLSNDRRIVVETSTRTKSQAISTLTIENALTEDGGLYSCKASNTAGYSYYANRINVYGKIGVRRRPKITAISSGTVSLNCPIYGYPIGTIMWERNNELLPSDIRQTLLSNGTLVIKNLHRSRDTGKYFCLINLNDEEVVRSEIELVVMVPPKIAPFSFQEDLVREGMRGRLQCVVLEGDLPLAISWEKDGLPVPDGVSIRQIDDFSSILTIPFISPRHNGAYTCTAKNSAATVRHMTRLSVNVSPKIIPFSFQDVNVIEGVLARVSCVVYQGDLPIQINWLVNGQTISPSLGVIIRRIDEYSSILTIEKVETKHTGNYTCIANNAAATITHTARLVVNVPPKIVPFTFQDDQLLEGMLVRVSCVVSRGDLPLSITWLKDGHPIPNDLSVKVRDFDEYSSVLSIDPVLKSHSGNYTCIASNQASQSIYTAQLLVQVPPKWITVPSDTTALNGEDVFLHCATDGLPKPVVTWMMIKGRNLYKPRQHVKTNINTKIYSNGTLQINKISKSDEGYYFCTSSNDIGTPLSKSVFLSVNAPPVIIKSSTQKNGRKNENVTLECLATGNLPITFEWNVGPSVINIQKENRFQTRKEDFPKKTESKSELTIFWLDRKDSGNIICKATNEYGSAQMEYKLSVLEAPDAPNIETPNSSNRSVNLSWKISFDGNSPIQQYLIQYKKQIDNWQYKSINVSVDGSQRHYTLQNLQPATTYNFRILAENEIGKSEFSNVISVATDEDVPAGAPLNVEVESIDTHTLRITWKPPKKNLWNGAIRGYNIGYKMYGSDDPFAFSTLEVPEDYTEDLIFQLKNLKMFSQYEIIVQAYNHKGAGPSCEGVLAMTSEDVPKSPPRDIRCSALSSKSIYVLWEAPEPESVNGILRGYKVLYKPADDNYRTELNSKTTQTTKITLHDLQVNTNYNIQLLAFTKVGDGVKSKAVFCKTHEDVPEALNAIKVLPASSDSVVVSWKPSKKPSGSITKYNIYYKPLEEGEEIEFGKQPSGDSSIKTDQLNKDATVHSSTSDSQFFEVKGLKKNKKYAFWVTASSVIGESPISAIMAQTVADSTVGAKSASFDDDIKTPWKQDIVLSCKSVGVPTPQKKWFLSNKPLEMNNRMTLLSDGTLLINRVSSEDSGNYTCRIYNEFGKDEVKYFITVQVPPAAPIVDIIAKSRASIQIQWKPGPNGGDRIRGYMLHFRRQSHSWESREIPLDHSVYTLDGLACGANYEIYMNAFNSIGTGTSCDIITVATEGAETIPPHKDDLIREGITFITVNLDSWPNTGCPIENFRVDYKEQGAKDWILLSRDIKPTQKKLVIPGLKSATWYILRVTANTSGGGTATEYKFATHTANGGTVAPESFEKELDPLYIFYLDPYIFIPAVALLIVVIIASAVVCIIVKRRNGSEGTPSEFYSDAGSQLNTWTRTLRTVNGTFIHADGYATIRKGNEEQGPFVSSQMPDPYPGRSSAAFSEALPPWMTTQNTLHRKSTRISPNNEPTNCNAISDSTNIMGTEETTFVFPSNMNRPPFPTQNQTKQEDDYDPPPFGI